MKRAQKIVHILIVLLLLMGITGSVFPTSVDSLARAHPLLVELAAEDPDRMVSVIAQKADTTGRVESLVTRLGGRLTKDLHIINALAAELTVGAALELSRHPAVRWVSLDSRVERAARPIRDTDLEGLPENTYLDTLNVQPVWDMGIDGYGIGVAVIDSGITTDRDFTTEPGRPFSRILEQISFSENSFKPADATGHGTHVAGIIGGNGFASAGLYVGIAPKVNLLNLKISDENGMAYESDAVAALQWVFENKDAYNIRVVNISLNSSVESSYHYSPMDAAVEILWFNGVVVVVSAGNLGDENYSSLRSAPANDPFVITVGATEELGTSDRTDDLITGFSPEKVIFEDYSKPDIYAPGKDIISVLSDSSSWDELYPGRVVLDGEYFRLSGTSMAAPMVTGAVALLLQDEPNLTPDQVKYRLIHASDFVQGEPYLDAYGIVNSSVSQSANSGLIASQLLWTGEDPVNWDSVAWNSVAWNSVAWNSVAWNSVAWNSVAWNSVFWGK